MDALSMLKKQHREVEALFRKAEKATQASMRRQLVDQIVTKLEMHARLEEEIVYPAIREVRNKKAEEMVLEAYEEHAVVKLVLRQLPDADPHDERFPAKITVLMELVKHHVEEEEKEMFRLAEKLGKDQLQSLGEQMMQSMPEGERPRGRRRAA